MYRAIPVNSNAFHQQSESEVHMPGQGGVSALPRHAGAHLCDAAGNARAGGSKDANKFSKPVCATRTLPPLSLTDMLCYKKQNAQLQFYNLRKHNRISHHIINRTVAQLTSHYN